LDGRSELIESAVNEPMEAFTDIDFGWLFAKIMMLEFYVFVGELDLLRCLGDLSFLPMKTEILTNQLSQGVDVSGDF
jgi:hypothetical protein